MFQDVPINFIMFHHVSSIMQSDMLGTRWWELITFATQEHEEVPCRHPEPRAQTLPGCFLAPQWMVGWFVHWWVVTGWTVDCQNMPELLETQFCCGGLFGIYQYLSSIPIFASINPASWFRHASFCWKSPSPSVWTSHFWWHPPSSHSLASVGTAALRHHARHVSGECSRAWCCGIFYSEAAEGNLNISQPCMKWNSWWPSESDVRRIEIIEIGRSATKWGIHHLRRG